MDAVQVLNGRSVAILGAGLVGAGWAIAFARAGVSVRIFDADSSTAEGVLPFVAKQLEVLQAQKLIKEAVNSVLSRMTVVPTAASALEGAAYVQESVLERVDVKRRLMVEIGDAAAPDVVVGSSSSGIPASAFALGLSITPRVLIVHPVNPPYLIPLVELVPTAHTSLEAMELASSLMQAIGQSVIHVRREVEGFVLNRLQAALLREAWSLVRDGVATCEDVDKTVRDGLGLRWSFMGPFETIDLNAPGGVADYARRLGALYLSIANSRKEEGAWDSEWISLVEEQRRRHLPLAELASRRAWRDARLMKMAVLRLTSDDQR
jgi:L-gulonate 3-dehydrogenase